MADGLTEAMFASVLDGLPDPVVILGPDITLIWANRQAEASFGWNLDELRGQGLVGYVHPDDLDTAILSLTSVATKDVGSLIEIRVRHHDGTFRWVEVRGAPWPDSPEPGAIILVVRESTDRRRWELGGGDTEVLTAVFDATPTITLLLAADGTVRSASRALTRQLHRPLDQTLGLPLEVLIEPSDRPAVRAALAAADGSGGSQTLEVRLLATDGAAIPMSLTIVDLLADGAVEGLVVAAADISQLAEARTELHHLANHDDLTGLPNRSHLLRRLNEMLAREPTDPHTLIFGDLDGLKQINDTYGHQAGDALLAEVAARLRQVMRTGDFVARLSGDEFVVMVPTDDPAVVEEVMRRIQEVLVAPARLPDGLLVVTSMSLGSASAEPGVGAEEILAIADAAMYVAKRSRPGA